jgi:hypothetical protein
MSDALVNGRSGMQTLKRLGGIALVQENRGRPLSLR